MRIYHFSRTPIYKSGAIFRSNWCHLKRGPTSVIQIVNSKYPLFRCWSLTLWILIAADKESLGCGHYYCIKSVSYINRKKRRNRMVLVIEFECHIKGKWYRWHIFREALIVFFLVLLLRDSTMSVCLYQFQSIVPHNHTYNII